MALPLRLTIATTFAVLAVVSVSVVTGVNFLGGRDAIQQTASLKIEASAESAQEAVERLLIRSGAAASSVANLPPNLFNWRDSDPLFSSLMIALKNRPEVYGVFVGFPDGAFIQAVRVQRHVDSRNETSRIPDGATIAWRTIGAMESKHGRPARWRYFDNEGNLFPDMSGSSDRNSIYDPRTRPWFKSALQKNSTTVTNPYIFESLRQPGITVSHPVVGVPGAVVGIDLSLGDLSKLARRLKPGVNGMMTITDADGRIIGGTGNYLEAFNRSKKIPVVSEVDDPLLTHTLDVIKGHEESLTTFQHDGHRFVGARTLATDDDGTQWTIISAANLRDFTGGLEDTLYNSLIISGVILLVSIGIVTGMAGWISRPVLKIREMADQITRLNLSKIETFNSPFEEISQLQNSMDQMRNALDTSMRFIPQDVVRNQLMSGKKADVGGTRREVTLLFTDIEGFTTISEQLTPEQIMAQVSVYFEQLSFAIQCNLGTIDKFIGDAIMAMWNAPTEDDEHVQNACRAVLTARQISADLNDEFEMEGLPRLHTRFGLHTCEALVGNVGAPDRMQYTCLGSGVNLASRIEGLNKFYRTQILVSDSARRRAGAGFLFRRIDLVRAKGTTRPITIYELFGERHQDAPFYVGPEIVKMASSYEQAFDFYLHRDFKDAVQILEPLYEERPDDYVICKLLEKCRAYEIDPPPPEWDGSTALDEK